MIFFCLLLVIFGCVICIVFIVYCICLSIFGVDDEMFLVCIVFGNSINVNNGIDLWIIVGLCVSRYIGMIVK